MVEGSSVTTVSALTAMSAMPCRPCRPRPSLHVSCPASAERAVFVRLLVLAAILGHVVPQL